MKYSVTDEFEIKPRLMQLFNYLLHLDVNGDEIQRRHLKAKLPNFNLNTKLIYWLDNCFGGDISFKYVGQDRFYKLKIFRNYTEQELTDRFYVFLFEFGNITKKHLEKYI